MTPNVSSTGAPDVSGTGKEVTKPSPDDCTAACTGEPDSVQPDPVAALAATLLGLSATDKARLAALLLGQSAGTSDRPGKGTGSPAGASEGVEVGDGWAV